MDQAADTIWIAEQAKGIGFDLCGVVRAEKFPELENTKDWLKRGYAGEMNYLFDPRREDPRGAMPGVQSVIVCLLNYNTDHPLSLTLNPEAKSMTRGAGFRVTPGATTIMMC